MTPTPGPKAQGPHVADVISTGVGGAAGLGLIYQVNWNLIPYGEVAKACVGLAIIIIGGLLYHGTRQEPKE